MVRIFALVQFHTAQLSRGRNTETQQYISPTFLRESLYTCSKCSNTPCLQYPSCTDLRGYSLLGNPRKRYRLFASMCSLREQPGYQHRTPHASSNNVR